MKLLQTEGPRPFFTRFEMSFRVDVSSCAVSSPTSGPPISKRMAVVAKGMERMGGSVGVESELGKGSQFWIQLQIAESG